MVRSFPHGSGDGASPWLRNYQNLAANLAAFVVTFAISFLLSPFIVRTLGVEANGLIGLSTSFLNYASVLTIFLGSMTSRFVTIELRSGDVRAANEYYTASKVSDLVGAAVLLPIMVLVVINFGNWLDVPEHLVVDAQWLSSLLFLSLLLSLVVPRWKVATWATNNLYLDSLRSMQSHLLRGALIIAMFSVFEPAVSYVGVAALLAGIFDLGFSGYYKHRLLPDLRISLAHYSWARQRELLTAGFWTSVNYLGSLLGMGFHLLLANVFLGATHMGLLALAMTVPAMINQLSINLTGVFMPSLAFAFAERDFLSMRRQAKRAMSVTSLLTAMPLAALIAFGGEFFALWVPSQNAAQLNLIAIAAAAGLVVACGVQPLQNIFVITNSQRTHSIAAVSMGALNVGLAALLLRTTDLGVFAILLAAAVSVTAKSLLFTVPMAARRVESVPGVFLGEVARSIGYLAVLVSVGAAIRAVSPPATWLGFVVSVVIMCVCGSLVNLLLLMGRSDRQQVSETARRLLHWRH